MAGAAAAAQSFGLSELLPEDAMSATYQALVTAMAGILATVNSGDGESTRASAKGADVDELPKTYDVERIRAYWGRRPAAVAKRSAAVVGDVIGWVVALLVDIQTGNVEKNWMMH